MSPRLGLRIDVDTLRGTRRGVPTLCRMLSARGLKATFFFSVGPDNMGRHLFRLLKPAFLAKMLRTRAGSLYGWDILLKGTLWPGPRIGRRAGSIIRAAADEGHEIGVHAWDHHRWQMGVDRLGEAGLSGEMQLAHECLTELIGRPPTCSAAPGWRCTDEVLRIKTAFPFEYNSDCRGRTGPFRPCVDGEVLSQPQIPVTLPTWDEVAGTVPDDEYNQYLIDQMDSDRDEVLTIHAEAEGLSKAALFEDFLDRMARIDRRVVPLGTLIDSAKTLPVASLEASDLPGREGWVATVSGRPPENSGGPTSASFRL